VYTPVVLVFVPVTEHQNTRCSEASNELCTIVDIMKVVLVGVLLCLYLVVHWALRPCRPDFRKFTIHGRPVVRLLLQGQDHLYTNTHAICMAKSLYSYKKSQRCNC
jgi:hypothetical protein